MQLFDSSAYFGGGATVLGQRFRSHNPLFFGDKSQNTDSKNMRMRKFSLAAAALLKVLYHNHF